MMRKRMVLLAMLSGVVAGAQASAATSEQVEQPHCLATLLTETDAVQPGRPFTVGLLLEADEHWHTYWRNPGESGLATKIEWMLPQGFEAGEIQWPTPTKFVTDGPIVNFGYEGPVLLLVEVRTPETIETQQVALSAKATWLVCNPNACLPGKAELNVELPVVEVEPAMDASVLGRFAAAREGMPRTLDRQRMAVSREENTVTLTVDVELDESSKTLGLFEADIEFFPADGGAFEVEPAAVAQIDGSLHIVMTIFDARNPPQRLRGVLKMPVHSYWIDAPVDEDAPQPEGDSP